MNLIYEGGYGVGKTRELVDIYLDIVGKNEAAASEILFFCMDEHHLTDLLAPRLLDIMPGGCSELWIDNYSSFCRKILKKHYRLANIPKDFKVLSGFEQRFILEKILNDSGLKLEFYDKQIKYPGFISNFVNIIDLIELEEDEFKNSLPTSQLLYRKKRDILKIYSLYKNELIKYNFFDYKGLIFKVLELFDKNKDILQRYQKDFKYIFIDDLEEITHLDYRLIRKLVSQTCHPQSLLWGSRDRAKRHGFPESRRDSENDRGGHHLSLIAAGNKDGSIYKFRGADPLVLFDRFKKEFDCTVKYLDINRKQNIDHELRSFINERDEIYWIGRKIRDLVRSGKYQFKDIVITRRSFKNDASIYRDIFKELDMPVYIHEGAGIFSHPIIINLIFFLKALNAKDKNRAEWKERALALARYSDYENKNNFSEIIDTYKHKSQDLAIEELVYDICKEFKLWDTKYIPFINAFYETVSNFSILERQLYKKNKEESELESFILYLDKMLTSYTFDTKVPFDDINVVNIMTIQKLKGRFFPVVFFCGAAEGIIPKTHKENPLLRDSELRELNINVIKDLEDFIAQEEHIFDLGLSRATAEMYITYAKNYKTKKDLSLSSFVKMADVFEDDELNRASLNYEYNYRSDKYIDKVQTKEELKLYNIFNGKEDFLIDPEHIDSKEFYKILKGFSFSNSSVSQFKECPLKFMYSKLIGIDIQKDIFLIFGIIIHEILEEFHKKYTTFKNMSGLLVYDDMQKIIDEVFDRNRESFQGNGEMRWYKRKAGTILRSYIDDLKVQDNWEIVDLEKRFKIEIDRINFVGKIDRIDKDIEDELEIIDYKTGSSQKRTEKGLISSIQNEDDFQLALYYYAVKDLRKEKIKKLTYYLLEKETRGGKKVSISINDEKTDILDAAKAALIKEVKKIQKSKFPASPKSQYICTRCSYATLCD